VLLGWYLDIILGYPIRLLLRAFRERKLFVVALGAEYGDWIQLPGTYLRRAGV